MTLRKRKSKNVYDLDQVRLMPHPPLQIEEEPLARHFLATYALFRFCSHLPMAMTLPPVIRPFWSELLADKAAAPPHREWEWNPDPFAAKKEVEDRQSKKKDKDEKAAAVAEGGGGGSGRNTPGPSDGRKHGRAWEEAPEVRMAPALREMVEGVVKKVRICRGGR